MSGAPATGGAAVTGPARGIRSLARRLEAVRSMSGASWVMLVLALCGLAIAAYLSIAHASSATAKCLVGGGSCEKVQSSPHLYLVGVFIPYYALAGYTCITISLLLARFEAARLATVMLTSFGVAMTAYVTYLEAFVIHGWCMWCIASTFIMWTLFAMSVYRHLRA